MDTLLRVAWLVLVCVMLMAASAIVQAQGADAAIRLGPEGWFLVAGACVTIGINLEQVRRLRSDVRELKTDNKTNVQELKVESSRKHLENSGRLERVDRKLERVDARLGAVEETLSVLRRRRRTDRELDEHREENEKGSSE